MSWLYSRALVEASLGADFLDGEQCALWSGTHTQRASWLPAKTTGRLSLSRSGMTYKPLTDYLGEAILTSFLEAFPVKTSALPEKAQASTANDLECGDTWRELSVKYDRDSSSWKTHRLLFQEDLDESLVTFPKWGMIRDGVLLGRMTSALPTVENGSGSEAKWPTPTCQDANTATTRMRTGHQNNLTAVVNSIIPTPSASNAKGAVKNRVPGTALYKNNLDEFAENQMNPDGGRLNPPWVEWLMGWPIGWTDLRPLATDKSHTLRLLRGES